MVVAAVRIAVEDLVAQRGREGVTVPMVAERAGVNPTSIDRRWGDLNTLVSDIASVRLNPSRDLPNTGDLREDLTRWAAELIVHYAHPVNASLLGGAAATASVAETDCTRARRGEIALLLDRTDAEGIVVEDVINLVVAPIIYRAIFQPWTLEQDLDDVGEDVDDVGGMASRLVDGLLSRQSSDLDPGVPVVDPT